MTGRTFFSIAVLIGALAGCSPGRPQLTLTYSPSEARVTIDGYEAKKYSSPHTFEFFRPGRYRLDVSADGYLPVTMMIDVKEGETLTQSIHLVKGGGPGPIAVDPPPDTESPPPPPPPPPPPAGSFAVQVNSVPEGARISVARPGSGTSVDQGRTPARLTLSTPGPWEVTLQLDGYRTARRIVLPPASSGPVVFTQILSRDADVQVPAPPVPPDPPVPLDPPMPSSDGFLSVVSTPSTTVSVDGIHIGNTPVNGYPIAAGSHRVLMENRDQGLRRIKVVEIPAGGHVRLAEEF